MSTAVARFATEAERSDWDALILANPGGGEVWAAAQHLEVKRVNKYLPRHVIVERANRPPLAVGVLAKQVPLLGEWWNLMAGPAGEDLEAVLEAADAVAELARLNHVFLMKIEPRLGSDAEMAIVNAGYVKTQPRVPNVSTVLLDISMPENEILAGFAKKARNAITKAAREGVRVERVPATDENCARFYGLLSETAEGRFQLRPEVYFRTFWQSFAQAGQGQMFFAFRENDEDLLAGAFAMVFGETSDYKDGASLRVKKAYGTSHALQWEVIRWAHEHGAQVHDMCGVPPTDRADDTTHELHGVGRFKRSFSPVITDYVGAFERPLRRLPYRIWKLLGDRLARRISLMRRQDPYY